MWATDPERNNEEELSNWLTILGIPWVFRKLFIRSQRSSSKVVIAHVPNDSFDITTNVAIFGTWHVDVKLNDTWANSSSRLGDPIRIHGVENNDGSIQVQIKNTKSGVFTVITISYEAEYLRLHREIYTSGRKEGQSDAVLSTYLLRKN